MKIIMIISILTLLGSALYSESAPRINDDPFTTNALWFDSLNVNFTGNWPFGPSGAVVCDPARNISFCGAGGGVYILDATNPSMPSKITESLHTRGIVEDLFYDTGAQRLYVADK
jgi:hypothetical protein